MDINNVGARPRRLRTYNEEMLIGKIMRVDREGRGLADHPFCPGVTDLDRTCTKLYAKGFRNPYGMDFNADGERTTLRTYNDDDTYSFQHWDANDNKSWSSVTEFYDANGLYEREYVMDSQHIVRILYDSTDSESWSSLTKVYDQTGKLIDECKVKDHDYYGM